MHSARMILVLLALLVAGDSTNAQLVEGPVDGVGLLDYCSTAEIARQPQETRKILGDKIYQEKLNKYYWCLGYVGAILDSAMNAQASFQVADQFGVALSGPERKKEFISAKLRVACFPLSASVNDLIFVLIRWLSEHEQRLHEPRAILASEAFGSRFPCGKTIRPATP